MTIVRAFIKDRDGVVHSKRYECANYGALANELSGDKYKCFRKAFCGEVGVRLSEVVHKPVLILMEGGFKSAPQPFVPSVE